MREGSNVESLYANRGKAVSIMKIYIKNTKKEINKNLPSYSIDIECFDVFLTDFTKRQVEKLCGIVLSSAPEIQIYRHVRDRIAIIEFSASQLLKGSYKVTVGTAFKDYVNNIKGFNNTIDIISKSIIERIIYIYTAYSLDSY